MAARGEAAAMKRLLLALAAATVLAGCANPDESTDPIGGGGEPVTARAEHDFAQGDGDATLEVPETAAYDLRVAFEPTEPGGVCGEDEVYLVLTDPDGNVKIDERSTTGLLDPTAACGAQAQSGVVLPAGTWTVQFRGEAPVRGVVEIERVS